MSENRRNRTDVYAACDRLGCECVPERMQTLIVRFTKVFKLYIWRIWKYGRSIPCYKQYLFSVSKSSGTNRSKPLWRVFIQGKLRISYPNTCADTTKTRPIFHNHWLPLSISSMFMKGKKHSEKNGSWRTALYGFAPVGRFVPKTRPFIPKLLKRLFGYAMMETEKAERSDSTWKK